MQQQGLSPTDSLMRAKARAELERQKKYERYKFYEPNGKIESFIKLVGSGEVFVALLSAANGVGKTAAGCNIVAHIIYSCSCPWFDYPLFKNFPYLKKGRIASDPTTIKEQIVPELKAWLPAGRYTAMKSTREFESRWKTDTGHEFDLMTYEQETKEYESVSLGWAWFDEPPPEDKYKATVSRMRRGGIIFITETPLTGSAWLYDRFITSEDRVI
jgi:phage terminase large subunit-like protein